MLSKIEYVYATYVALLLHACVFLRSAVRRLTRIFTTRMCIPSLSPPLRFARPRTFAFISVLPSLLRLPPHHILIKPVRAGETCPR